VREAVTIAERRGLEHPLTRDASIRRVDLGEGGFFYRAEVGSFATAEQAMGFCDNLKAAGGQCIVQRRDWGGPGP
jgi:hypothetical protein